MYGEQRRNSVVEFWRHAHHVLKFLNCHKKVISRQHLFTGGLVVVCFRPIRALEIIRVRPVFNGGNDAVRLFFCRSPEREHLFEQGLCRKVQINFSSLTFGRNGHLHAVFNPRMNLTVGFPLRERNLRIGRPRAAELVNHAIHGTVGSGLTGGRAERVCRHLRAHALTLGERQRDQRQKYHQAQHHDQGNARLVPMLRVAPHRNTPPWMMQRWR